MRSRAGQGLVEYVLVVGLVGLGLIGAVSVFRKAVERSYGEVTRALEGIAAEVATQVAPAGGGAPARTRTMRMTDECTHPRALADEALGLCTGCGEPL